MTTELNDKTLEWAAQWLEGSIKGEDNERAREFARNMAMTFRAAKLPDSDVAASAAPTVGEAQRIAEQIVKAAQAHKRTKKLVNDIAAAIIGAAVVQCSREQLGYDPAAHAENMQWLKEHEAERLVKPPQPSDSNAAIAPAAASLAALRDEAHPEDFCEKCKRPNIVWFAPNELWNKAVRAAGEPEILCPVCFVQLVEAMGANYIWQVVPQDYSATRPSREAGAGE